METTTKEMAMTFEQLVNRIYEELKLQDRCTPGRTPWQILRKRAEEMALLEAK